MVLTGNNESVSDAKSNSRKEAKEAVVDSEALKFNDDDAGGVEYKRGLEAISYDHDARRIKYKRGLEVMSWGVVYQIQATGVHHGGGRRQQMERGGSCPSRG
jgi:hypothetical protein